ncbi:hypothetical protein HNR60_001547 [Rhodopseudomonas rhenobacensis]|uniref:DUF4376 domain-containing protein n=1 Tax=Rhodopseudomonas rhenobacensis TaxID=87461 RepID=A0A7W7Z2M0_9BRAD|nr:DUF4376 domain-containing protein [Rhodopseudomonas rhenobacensis]MBB5046799.1 hypothetical protein [Rhodopseudomonas rhenobacensis]
MHLYAVFTPAGFPAGFYSDDIHGPRLIDGQPNPDCRVPAEAVEITEPQWRDLLAHPGLRRLVDGAVVDYTPPEQPIDLPAYTAAVRWAKETGGTAWSGWPVATDDRSQGKILAELTAIDRGQRADPDGWKFADGEFRLVSNADFVTLAMAVRAHVRACFAAEASVLAGIAAGSITTTAQIDNAFG